MKKKPFTAIYRNPYSGDSFEIQSNEIEFYDDLIPGLEEAFKTLETRREFTRTDFSTSEDNYTLTRLP